MGEEKKDKTDNLQSVMDTVADIVANHETIVSEYAYQKAQLDTLKRYICTAKYADKEEIMRLMGWDKDGKY